MHPSTNIGRFIRVLLVASLIASVSVAQQLTATLIEDGFARPVCVTSPPGDTQRLFVVEQHTRRIEIIKNGVLQATPLLTVQGITTGEEQGLLGLAFHPAFAYPVTPVWLFSRNGLPACLCAEDGSWQ